MVIKNEIKINNVAYDKIIETIKSNGISEIDGNYNDLLNIPLYKLTKEELSKLRDDYLSLKNTLLELEETKIEDMWKKDLNSLKVSLKKYYKS